MFKKMSARKTNRKSRKLAVETLEERRLMTATSAIGVATPAASQAAIRYPHDYPKIDAFVKGDTLYVNGTEYDDQIVVHERSFPTGTGVVPKYVVLVSVDGIGIVGTDIHKIEVHGFGGDDSIKIVTDNAFLTAPNFPFSDKTFGTGAITTLLDGGAGNDTIEGGNAADVILGGEGTNLFYKIIVLSVPFWKAIFNRTSGNK